jgi:hypothetical protein
MATRMALSQRLCRRMVPKKTAEWIRLTGHMAFATWVMAGAAVMSFGTSALSWLTLRNQLQEMRSSSAERPLLFVATAVSGNAKPIDDASQMKTFDWSVFNYGKSRDIPRFFPRLMDIFLP